MNYKQVLTYNFSIDETRNSFEELLNDMGFRDMPDQSTWALLYSSRLTKHSVINLIIEWSKDDDNVIKSRDFVHVFRSVAVADRDGGLYPGIDTVFLRYDATTKGLK